MRLLLALVFGVAIASGGSHPPRAAAAAADPREWTNLAKEPRFAAVKKEVANWVPARSAAPLPNSTGRFLTFDKGVPV